MKYKTQYDEKKVRYYTNTGEKEHIVYSSKFDENGNIVLFEAGRQNIPEFINSHAESVDINVILQRFTEGDTSALSRRQLMFGDFTQTPKTLADALNLVIAGENMFNSLDPEDKKKFNNNFVQWLATLDKVKAEEEVAAQPAEVPSAGGEAKEQA